MTAGTVAAATACLQPAAGPATALARHGLAQPHRPLKTLRCHRHDPPLLLVPPVGDALTAGYQPGRSVAAAGAVQVRTPRRRMTTPGQHYR